MRLWACDSVALKAGLSIGLSLADARARIPDMVAIDADIEADQRLLDRLAAFCERFTPHVAYDTSERPDGLVLDITGCGHLFGGEAPMRRLICDKIKHLGLHARASIANTPQAARALARFSTIEIAPAGPDEAMVSALPVEALEADADTILALKRAGLKTIADVASRSFTALAARFGEVFTMRLKRILGRENIRITPLRPLPDCMVEQHFPEPLLDSYTLEAALNRLFKESVQTLERRGQGGRRFEVHFFRSDGAVRRIALETGRPSRDLASLRRLYKERLDTLADPIDPGFGFDAIRLAIPVCEPLILSQPGLDGQANQEDMLSDLVDRLVARFGNERIMRFSAQDTHQPEGQYREIAAATADKTSTGHWPLIEPDGPPRRPFQMFDPPQPIETIAEVPDGPPVQAGADCARVVA
eukprot:gene13166-13271_t